MRHFIKTNDSGEVEKVAKSASAEYPDMEETTKSEYQDGKSDLFDQR